jgi:ABC-2 type transport system ATP-binding protein
MSGANASPTGRSHKEIVTPAIEIKGLTKAYRSGFMRRKVHAVRNLDLTIERESVVAFVGPNGAGKTTTIHTLLGFLKPDDGSVFVLGRPAEDRAARSFIGYQSEIFHTYRFHTAWQALQFYGTLSGMPDPRLRKAIPELLARLGLKDAMHQCVGTFSKGMTQRLGLAQALLHEPELLILDEPTSGLDPEGRKLVADIIVQERAKGRTIFLSSHILSDVERVCDRVFMIRKGELVYSQAIDKTSISSEHWEVEVHGWTPDSASLLTDCEYELASVGDDRALLRCSAAGKRGLLQKLVVTPLDIAAVRPTKAKSLEDLYMEYVGGSNSA